MERGEAMFSGRRSDEGEWAIGVVKYGSAKVIATVVSC